MDMTNQDFVDKLLPESPQPLWLIVTCNVLDGLDAGLYDQDFVREAIDRWREEFLRFKASSPTEDDKDLLSASLDELVTYKTPSGQSFCLRSVVSTSEELVLSYSHSMRADSFVSKVLPAEEQEALAEEGKLGRAGIAVFPNLSTSFECRVGERQGIGQPKKVVFLAPFSKVAPLLGNKNKSSLVRDRLGLVHWKQGAEYVALEIAYEVPTSSCLGRPTFVDAGAHRRFKAVASDPTNKSRAAWGFTLDLEQFAKTSAVTDGIGERVCERIEGSRISSVLLHPLGFLSAEDRATTASDNDAKYAECLCNGRSVADIATRIKEIVQ